MIEFVGSEETHYLRRHWRLASLLLQLTQSKETFFRVNFYKKFQKSIFCKKACTKFKRGTLLLYVQAMAARCAVSLPGHPHTHAHQKAKRYKTPRVIKVSSCFFGCCLPVLLATLNEQSRSSKICPIVTPNKVGNTTRPASADSRQVFLQKRSPIWRYVRVGFM